MYTKCSGKGCFVLIRESACLLYLIYIVTEGMDNPLGEVEIKKMKDQLRKEQDTSATLLQELHDTRTQVNSSHLFDMSFFLYSFFHFSVFVSHLID